MRSGAALAMTLAWLDEARSASGDGSRTIRLGALRKDARSELRKM
jgi:hypothetical protein